MDSVLYPNFLHDQTEYLDAARLWTESLDRVFLKNEKHELWRTPWLITRFANGEMTFDGNPIYSAICDAESKAVRIVQEDSEGGEGFVVWVEPTEWVTIRGDTVYLLTIVCVLTSRTLAETVAVVDRWVNFQGELQLFEPGMAT